MMIPTLAFPNTAELAASITRAASTQTYYTIRLLADRARVNDAFRAYAYFRWVDDELDAQSGANAGNSEFVRRQQLLLENCYQKDPVLAEDPHEQILIDLVRAGATASDGLQIYLRNMMAVMAFDASRRGCLISRVELHDYTNHLASAVMEALHYFIGHDCFSPHDDRRYLAVSAAHITHMLRDTVDDLKAGYYNIPREVLQSGHISPADLDSEAYREWVRERAQMAREQFESGRAYLRHVQNPRCRLACCAYISRFTGVLDLIEQDGYLLRPSYPETKGLSAILHAAGAIFASYTDRHRDFLASPGARSRQRS